MDRLILLTACQMMTGIGKGGVNMRKVILFFLLSALWLWHSALAIDTTLDDDVKEQKAQEIFNVIRCPVCHGQSIKESELEISRILRDKVRQMVKEGKDTEEIINFLNENYGAYITFDPEKQKNTFILRYLPIAIFLIGFVFFLRKVVYKNNQ